MFTTSHSQPDPTPDPNSKQNKGTTPHVGKPVSMTDFADPDFRPGRALAQRHYADMIRNQNITENPDDFPLTQDMTELLFDAIIFAHTFAGATIEDFMNSGKTPWVKTINELTLSSDLVMPSLVAVTVAAALENILPHGSKVNVCYGIFGMTYSIPRSALSPELQNEIDSQLAQLEETIEKNPEMFADCPPVNRDPDRAIAAIMAIAFGGHDQIPFEPLLEQAATPNPTGLSLWVQFCLPGQNRWGYLFPFGDIAAARLSPVLGKAVEMPQLLFGNIPVAKEHASTRVFPAGGPTAEYNHTLFMSPLAIGFVGAFLTNRLPAYRARITRETE